MREDSPADPDDGRWDRLCADQVHARACLPPRLRPPHPLLLGGTRPARPLPRRAPEHWAAAHEHFQYTPVLSEPDPADGWQGRTGFVHEAVLADHPDLSAYDVYMSGPPPMIDAARTAFLVHGLDPDHLYFDAFDYAVDPPE
ncbi:MAG: hypothetical protein U5L11_13995 [Arhodomonas sp.]|nr:hypothetical protein [Arhodomonas sp.]